MVNAVGVLVPPGGTAATDLTSSTGQWKACGKATELAAVACDMCQVQQAILAVADECSCNATWTDLCTACSVGCCRQRRLKLLCLLPQEAQVQSDVQDAYQDIHDCASCISLFLDSIDKQAHLYGVDNSDSRVYLFR